jgi:hypothetical protein
MTAAKQRSLLRAYVVAPLLAPILYFIWGLTLNFSGVMKMTDIPFLGAIVFFVAMPVSYLATAVFGIPYYRFLRRIERLSLPNLVIGGAILGVITTLLLQSSFFFFMRPDGISSYASIGVSELFSVGSIGAVLGGSVAWCFYYLSGITNHSSAPLRGRTR